MDYDVKGLNAKIVKEAIMTSGKTTTEYGRFAYNFLYSDESFFRYARKTILNANKLGKRTIIALLTGIVRNERINEGLIKENIESGFIRKCLIRLSEIDQ